jgi:diguanylate cyclase (GGDEF)-like protein
MLLSEAFERQKEITRTILDAQDSFVVVLDGAKIVEANRAFFEFFGFQAFADLGKAGFSLGAHFIHKQGFLSDLPEETWLDQLLSQPGRPRKVLVQRAGDEATTVFLAMLKAIPRTPPLYVVNLTNVTDMETESRRFEHLATIDPLTGILNRIKIVEALKQEVARCRRYGGALSLVLLDIDHFKQINDTHGHQTGDQVLVDLAQVIQANVRVTDVFARWGGEEFIVLAPQTDLVGARRLAEHLRSIIEAHGFPAIEHLTCSFGVSEFGEDKNVDLLIKEADTALYDAKRSGRNCVRTTAEVLGPQPAAQADLR